MFSLDNQDMVNVFKKCTFSINLWSTFERPKQHTGGTNGPEMHRLFGAAVTEYPTLTH